MTIVKESNNVNSTIEDTTAAHGEEPQDGDLEITITEIVAPVRPRGVLAE